MMSEEAKISNEEVLRRFDAMSIVGQQVLQITAIAIASLTFGNRRTRRHSAKTVQKLYRSIATFGFVRPILIDADRNIIDGHALVEAAKELGLKEVPAIVIDHLSPAKLKALKFSLNRLQELGEWDEAVLRDEFQSILELDETFELEVTGFELPEIDRILVMGGETESVGTAADEADTPPDLSTGPAIARPGDRFVLDKHSLYCGDARAIETVEIALDGKAADVVFTDPPYNVRIQGHVGGSGDIKHREFVAASGEMSNGEFAVFLRNSVAAMAEHCRDGAVLYVCMDWRSIELLLGVCRKLGLTLLNLCVWVKSNGGMGSFYRSRHELVAVLRKGDVSHINNVQLGQFGRYRTNTWEYPGLNVFSAERMEHLSAHPTVKPVALVRDAILDSTNRNDLVLDPFGGSGTTMIAAEKAKRRSCLIEIDPLYCDLIIRRFQDQFDVTAIHEATDLTFAELADQRRREAVEARANETSSDAAAADDAATVAEDGLLGHSGESDRPTIPDQAVDPTRPVSPGRHPLHGRIRTRRRPATRSQNPSAQA